ncbi:MAG: hypothetical protein HKM07_05155 [Chlamydiae bacterium]|nr:hypothetical protein [Chlamydiota bacterium]
MSTTLKRVSSLPDMRANIALDPTSPQKSSPTALQRISDFGETVQTRSADLKQKAVEAAPTKLDTSEVFDIIRKGICVISGERTKGTGFLYGGVWITSFHVIEGEIRREMTLQAGKMVEYRATTEKVRVEFQGKLHEVYFPVPTYDYNTAPFKRIDISYLPNASEEYLNARNGAREAIDNYFEKCRKLDMITLQVPTIDLEDSFEIIDDSFVIKEGMKVYFGGYPFSQSSVTFGKGSISSIERDPVFGVQHFIIEGTSVAGNSGSPVFIQFKGKVYLVGMVVAQVANWGADLNETFSWMDTFKSLNRLQGNSLALHGANGKEATFHFDELVFQSLLGLKSNISTGIGKVIDIRCLAKLRNAEIPEKDVHERSKEGEIPITTSQKPIKRVVIKNTEILNPIGMRAINGKEIRRDAKERDIDISFTYKDGRSMNARYEISPSPHEDETDKKYKNDEGALYQAALDTWARQFNPEEPFPGQFTFKAYGHEFKATQESLSTEEIEIRIEEAVQSIIRNIERLGQIPSAIKFANKKNGNHSDVYKESVRVLREKIESVNLKFPENEYTVGLYGLLDDAIRGE